MNTRPEIARADLIEGMAKGMAVLESFDTERQRLNATLAAQRTGLSRAAARRHLLTLAHLGYVETDGSYFWLSPKVLRFSGSYLASARLPAYATSTGRVLLAAKTKADLNLWMKGRVLARLTAHTVSGLRPLRAVLDQARDDDFCLACEEHEIGVQAVAVALRNMQGHTLAALNVVLPGPSVDPLRTRQQWVPVLQQAARELRPLL